MRYEIKESHPGEIPEITARIQAAGTELRGFIRDLLLESAELGQKVAEAEAPRGDFRQDREGGRISNAIQVSGVQYSPGGAGGGGFYEVKLYADASIAPQLQYVFEGTAGEGTGKIYPARGNVLTFEKMGEGRKFRPWVHGQKPQTEWWESARRAMDLNIDTSISGRMNLGSF